MQAPDVTKEEALLGRIQYWEKVQKRATEILADLRRKLVEPADGRKRVSYLIHWVLKQNGPMTVRELQRALGISIQAVRRELKNELKRGEIQKAMGFNRAYLYSVAKESRN